MISSVALYALAELLDWNELYQLGEDQLAVIHRVLLVNLSTRISLPFYSEWIQIDPWSESSICQLFQVVNTDS